MPTSAADWAGSRPRPRSWGPSFSTLPRTPRPPGPALLPTRCMKLMPPAAGCSTAWGPRPPTSRWKTQRRCAAAVPTTLSHPRSHPSSPGTWSPAAATPSIPSCAAWTPRWAGNPSAWWPTGSCPTWTSSRRHRWVGTWLQAPPPVPDPGQKEPDMTQPPSASSGIALWEERFGASDDYLYGTEPNRFLTAQAHRLAPGSTILAVADGEGRNGVWLAGQGHRVTAIDGSAAALQKSRRLARRQGVELRHLQADLLTWDWGDEHADAVAPIFIQAAGPEDRRRLVKVRVKARRPGGLPLLQGYRPEQLDYGTDGP